MTPTVVTEVTYEWRSQWTYRTDRYSKGWKWLLRTCDRGHVCHLKLHVFGQPCGHLQGCKTQRLDTPKSIKLNFKSITTILHPWLAKTCRNSLHISTNFSKIVCFCWYCYCIASFIVLNSCNWIELLPDCVSWQYTNTILFLNKSFDKWLCKSKVITVRRLVPLGAGHVVVLPAVSMSPELYARYYHVAIWWLHKSSTATRQTAAVTPRACVRSTETGVGAVPVQAWTGPEGSRRLRLPDF
jgi:hypothetical protein